MKTTTFKSITVAISLGAIVFINACSPPKEVDKLTLVGKIVIDMEDSATTNKKDGDAHGGNYFSRADSGNIYAAGSIFNIPDSVMQKDIRVKINAWVRIGDLSSDKKFAISLEDGAGNSMNWSQIDFRSHVSEANKWVNVIDSVTLPGNLITKSGAVIKTYSFNPDGKSTLDCDDIELTFVKVEKIKVE
ncbi:MAG: hypothetical protein V4580_09510 [Bacteroidota bacterium]